MTNQMTAKQFNQDLQKMEKQFKAALPEHISVDKFTRTALTAVQQTPELLQCDAKSVFSSLVQCASDGLLPNGREAALVIFNDWKNKTKQAQYMPMIAGVRKRMYNSGDIESVDAQVVYENDSFDYELGDAPRISHKPALENRGNLRLAYCVIRFKDGGIHREIMTKDEIYKARDVSKAKDKNGNPVGPWKDWESEMWRKTVLHRAAKAVPTSSDIEKFLQQDMARILGEKQEQAEKNVTPKSADEAIFSEDHGEPITFVDGETVDTETGEIMEEKKTA